MAFTEKKKRFIGAIVLLIFFGAWLFLLYKIPATEIVARIGIENSYALIFVLALIGGTSIIFPVPYYLVVATFAAGGSNPFLLAIMAGTGVSLGDSTSYLVGYGGREILNEKLRRTFNNFYNWAMKKPKWMFFSVLYLYPTLSPLPNDMIVVPLGLARFPYFKMIIPMWLGNMTFNLIAAFAGIYGFNFWF